MSSTKITASIVVDAMVESARATVGASEAAKIAAERFILSAKITAKAVSSGVSTASIAKDAKSRVEADRTLKGHMYVSPASVGYHARTGRVLGLPGKLDNGVLAQDVQSVIVKVAAADADAIIGKGEAQNATYDALVKAAKRAAKSREAAKAAETETETDETVAPTVPTVETVSASELFRQAAALVRQAVALGVENWDETAVEAAADVMIALDEIPAVEAVAA